ncbi:winged helix-turn-helix transcriptional regulator [Streptomyces phyllanthi]|uniref:Winged helix-turn-helix transcriptional regulator n=1 Tax=Streptomyces phyllanthi TaxID=1803180 RepID=A0A5N8WHS9_9ACTN|nr:winged helix-turn-helix transcriptional regulator [Streptomyces phyllanthi]
MPNGPPSSFRTRAMPASPFSRSVLRPPHSTGRAAVPVPEGDDETLTAHPKLEKRGFVERRPSPADRRAALVTVTPAGCDAIDTMFPRRLAAEAELLDGLGADRDRVVDALNLLERPFSSGR